MTRISSDSVTVDFDIENTGRVASAEVVAYKRVSDLVMARAPTAKRALKGARGRLATGSEKRSCHHHARQKRHLVSRYGFRRFHAKNRDFYHTCRPFSDNAPRHRHTLTSAGEKNRKIFTVSGRYGLELTYWEMLTLSKRVGNFIAAI